MGNKNSGFTLNKTAVLALVLLLAGLYALRWATDKRAKEAVTAPVPGSTSAGASQSPALPEDAYKYSNPDAHPPVIDAGDTSADSQADLFTKILSKSDGDACVKAYSSNPKQLAGILTEKYIELFNGPYAPATEENKVLFDNYLICNSLAGAMPLDCRSSTLREVCIAAAESDLVYAALNNDKNPAKCASFLDLAFDSGEERPAGVCGTIRTAVERRSPASCGQLKNAAQCEASLAFLKGKSACSRLKAGEIGRCNALAELMTADGWLFSVLKTRAASSCDALGAKMVKTFCSPEFVGIRQKMKEAGDAEMRVSEKKNQPK